MVWQCGHWPPWVNMHYCLHMCSFVRNNLGDTSHFLASREHYDIHIMITTTLHIKGIVLVLLFFVHLPLAHIDVYHDKLSQIIGYLVFISEKNKLFC